MRARLAAVAAALTALLLALSTLEAPRANEPVDFGAGAAPIEHDYWISALDLSALDEIVIEGEAETAGGLLLVLRIDDGLSEDYASRFNLEVQLPSGPFSLRAPLSGLTSPNGRALDPSDIRYVTVFAYGDPEARVTLTRLEARLAPTLPDGVRGYAFGAAGSALPPGFERITAEDPRIRGAAREVARPAPDPLLASGLRDVQSVQLDAPPGRYRVTVWSEDPGEWEYLPHPLRRVIRANGVDLRREELTRDSWLRWRYLRGLETEHAPEDDAYSAYGVHRGEARWADIDVGEDGVLIELGGDGPSARYISALTIEPAGQDDAYRAVESARAEWYRSYWRIAPDWREIAAADAPGAATLALTPDGALLSGSDGAPIAALRSFSAPGTGVRLSLAARSETRVPATARLLPPTRAEDGSDASPEGAAALDGLLWSGVWRLERRRPKDTLLTLGDNTLAPTGAGDIPADRPRRYEIWIETPADAPAGLYRGALELETPDGLRRVPIEIEVLDVDLPEIAEPVGFYLTEAPHLTWFSTDPLDRQRQGACDVRWLTRFDLRGSAPTVRAPGRGATLVTALDLRRAADFGLAGPWLAYNPIQPMQFEFTPEDGAALIAEVETAIGANEERRPVWSVADELSNPDGRSHDVFRPWVAALRAAAPGVLLAGHVNHPKDRAHLDAFDVVLTNAGFGLDPETLGELDELGLDVWIYNTFDPRVTAGYWLWATDAQRYVQWHARMPTADPFDPIDGREGDVQAILPSLEICPRQPAIHRDFLRIAEGAVDQRWLLWLDERTGPEAEALRAELRARAAEGWAAAAATGDREMARMRARIAALLR